jgi:hypothetical protein
MNNLIYIIGEAGSGKSTSFRNMNHDETFLISVEGKPLPFRGWKTRYTLCSQENPDGNMLINDSPHKIVGFLKAINDRKPHIKTIIIDDFGYTFMNHYMRRAREKGWDKFGDIACDAFMVIDHIKNNLRDDLTVILTLHTAIDSYGVSKIKTIGNMIDDKITLEGKVNYIFHSVVHEGTYRFATNFDGTRMARTPMGLYSDLYIDNDMQKILEDINNYDNGN